MRKWVVVIGLAAAAPAWAQQAVPEISFEATAAVTQLPADMYLGEVAGVAVNSKKHLFVFHRGSVSGPAFGAAAAQLLEFGADGKFIREIGKGLYAFAYAHTVRVDRSDNIWVVDKGSDMAVKFTPEGRVAMVFGRKKEASDEAVPWDRNRNPPLPHIDGNFRQPTDVTWDTQGNIFISDGYVNARVAKYDRNGDWVKSWGKHGSAQGEFNTPHSIASDSAGNIYVADRGNRRVQVFDPEGKFLREVRFNVPVPADARPAIGDMPNASSAPQFQAGAPWAICIPPNSQVMYVSDAFPGRIYKATLDGKVLGTLGRSGKLVKQFGWIHEIACPSENELFVAEVLNWRVQKLTLKPTGAATSTRE